MAGLTCARATHPFGILVLALVLGGCLDESTAVTCDDGSVCGAPRVCLPGGGCAEPEAAEACAGKADGEPCALLVGGGECRGGACTLARCGDGVRNADEACDDGNVTDDDACTNACASPACGDGIVQPTDGETCDDAAANGDDRACTLACVPARCGDGLRWLGVEACDDGNALDDDGCRTTCASPSCGDRVVQAGAGEACDDGDANGDDRACTVACQVNVCGDGKLLLGVEACDVGVGNDDEAGCTEACALAVCGDGKRWDGVEACDDGNSADGDGCRGDCRKVETCGDAVLDADESCDDGAAGLANPGDGCDACVATAWTATVRVGAEVAATSAAIGAALAVALDLHGNVFIADATRHQVLRVDAVTGALSTVAGTGVEGFAGDGGLATSARLTSPRGLAVDGTGNVFVLDGGPGRIRRIAANTGIITTVAGTGVYSSAGAGDGGLAISAQFASPEGLAIDAAGDLFVVDSIVRRVRKITMSSGLIANVAGVGTMGNSGDGGPATSAQFLTPTAVAVDAAGNLFIADSATHRIRRVDAVTRTIQTVAGTGGMGSTGDGGPATAARLSDPRGVAVDAAGNLYIGDSGNHRVRRVGLDGTISTFAGLGVPGFSGDGGPAGLATLAVPRALAVAQDSGALFVADLGNQRIRRVDPGTHVIATVAGSGELGFVGSGGAATSAAVTWPYGIAVDAAGRLYVADHGSRRVHRVEPATGAITTIAGNGRDGIDGDGGPAIAAAIGHPFGVAVDPAGHVYVASTRDHIVRRIDAATGIITTAAGTGVQGFAGDGGPAASAQLASPWGLAIDVDGGLLIADRDNDRVRRVDPDSGLITTIAGTGVPGWAGDGGPATEAELDAPIELAPSPDGGLYIADRDNHRIRWIDPGGTITTYAGTGVEGGSGDGGLATSATLASPRGLALDASGDLYVADRRNSRVRVVAAGSGIITTFAGGGAGIFAGDGGDALGATLGPPYGVAVGPMGEVYVADLFNQMIRRIEPGTGIITTAVGLVDPVGTGPAGIARLPTPRALASAGADLLIAGDVAGRVLALRAAPPTLEVVTGRYPQDVDTGTLARFRTDAFGNVGGVAYDGAIGRFYMSETSANRVHVVTMVVPDDEHTWTIASLINADGDAGTADGVAATAQLNRPTGLHFEPTTRVLTIADTGNHTIRALTISAAGAAGEVTTIAGTRGAVGFFGDGLLATDALLDSPSAITRCPNGDLFIADADNHRVRRIDAATSVITTVLGDGVAASAGQGTPAADFPVDGPSGIACDSFGNLVVTSRTTVRLLPAAIAPGEVTGIVDGTGPVQTIFGAPPRTTYPASASSCLTGVVVGDGGIVQVSDACQGLLIELRRQPLP